jgi:hypothetical protein
LKDALKLWNKSSSNKNQIEGSIAMRTRFASTIAKGAAILVLLSTLDAQLSTLLAQGVTAFTYQGQLYDGGQLANGSYDLMFGLPGSGGSAITRTDVPISNGLFITTLDFGGTAFVGTARSLEISVRRSGQGPFVPLSPANPITPVPYALVAGNLAGGGLTGTYSNIVSLANPSNIFAGSFSGNGAGLLNVDGLTLDGLFATNFWQTTGNAGTSPANGNFLGTTDDQPLQLRANNQTGLQMQYINADWGLAGPVRCMNIVNGYWGNTVADGCIGVTVAGGGGEEHDAYTGNVVLMQSNYVASSFCSIGGGAWNRAGTLVWGQRSYEDVGNYATVSGGIANAALGTSSAVGGGDGNLALTDYATVAGGSDSRASGIGAFVGGGGWDGLTWRGNEASGNASVVSGGVGNQAQASWGTVSGGVFNTAGPSGWATVGGGDSNTASGEHSTVPGGYQNMASGQYSFAAGRQAYATFDGAFVWNSYGSPATNFTDHRFHVLAPNGFSVDYDTQRPDGGGSKWVVIGTQFPGQTIGTWTGAYLSDGGAWEPNSDRNRKENFGEINALDILQRVACLPLKTWNYTNEATSVRHLGPVAQDFHAAFALNGADDRHIADVDEGGVALAAIQGLNQKLDTENAAVRDELKRRHAENAELRRRLEALEQIILKQKSN